MSGFIPCYIVVEKQRKELVQNEKENYYYSDGCSVGIGRIMVGDIPQSIRKYEAFI